MVEFPSSQKLKCQKFNSISNKILTNGQSTLFPLNIFNNESKGECDDHNTHHWSRHARPSLTYTQDISYSFVHVHIKSTCVEREKKGKRPFRLRRTTTKERHEKNEGYLRSKRHTEVFFSTCVENRYRFLACGSKKKPPWELQKQIVNGRDDFLAG